MGRFGRPQFPRWDGQGPDPYMPVGRRRMASKYMDADEIDSILRIQWKSLHSGSPYLEDYYYMVGEGFFLWV